MGKTAEYESEARIRDHTGRRKSREINPTLKELMALKRPGYHAAGKGLYLALSKTGTRSWVFRYVYGGRQREMGLGSLDRVGLAEARNRTEALRHQLGAGLDPIAEKRKAEDAKRLEAARRLVFAEAAHQYIESHRAAWSDTHAGQWEATLRDYAFPVFGKLPVAEIDTALVMKVLEPIWIKRAVTASRLRGRMESVLDWATTRGYRKGENPARWRGHLENLLPKPSSVQKTEHHAALPFVEVGAFMAELRKLQGTNARAMEFLVLAAARSAEVFGATWAELDQDYRVWTIPESRMKAGREHRIPLSERARDIILEQRKLSRGEFVFEGQRPGKPLGKVTFLHLLRRMGRGDVTSHGFRSTFRDWAGETTGYPREVIEHALAHQLKDKAEAAYARGTLFDKRRRLMDDWARYCETPQSAGDVVVPIRGAA